MYTRMDQINVDALSDTKIGNVLILSSSSRFNGQLPDILCQSSHCLFVVEHAFWNLVAV